MPSPDKHWLLGKIIHSIKDYYPFWQVHCCPLVKFELVNSLNPVGLPSNSLSFSVLHFLRPTRASRTPPSFTCHHANHHFFLALYRVCPRFFPDDWRRSVYPLCSRSLALRVYVVVLPSQFLFLSFDELVLI